MDDDFNTAGAVAAIFSLSTAANTYLADHAQDISPAVALRAADMLSELCGVLGIELEQAKSELPDGILKLAHEVCGYDGHDKEDAASIILAAREEARAQKQWDIADAIRDGIGALNLVIEDTAQGPRLLEK